MQTPGVTYYITLTYVKKKKKKNTTPGFILYSHIIATLTTFLTTDGWGGFHPPSNSEPPVGCSTI